MKRKFNYLIALALMAFTFTSCEDVPSPFGEVVPPKGDDVVVIEPSGTGTEADPFNIAGVIEYVSGLGADVVSPKDVYFKGIITSVTEAYGTQYGNATFEVSDTEDGGNKFLCYRVKYFDGQGYSNPSDPNIKEGNEVIMCGKVVNYKGNTPETSANAAWLYSLNGTKGGGSTPATETLGTKDAPITVAKALEYINKLEDNGTTKEDAYVTGKITKIKTAEADISKYKNIDYIISDGTNELTVFRGKNIDNADFTEPGQINVGDEVVVFGKLTKYVKDGNVTPEVAQGNYIVKLTKGGSTPSGGDAKGTGTASDPFNIAAAIAKCKEVGETASTEKYYIKGIVVTGGTVSGGYGNVTFKMGDSKDDTELFTAYQVAGSDGEKLADGYEVKAGSTVIVYGPIVNYKGNTPETSGKSAAQIVTIDGKKTNEGSGGGGQGGGGGETSSTLTNGDFETWANGQPTGWKSASTASSATLEQSTDAHSGSYACIVKGDEGNNKRLGSQEIKLAAGTYNFSFWVKPTTSDAAQVRPGYVPVTDGKAGSYAYGDYATLSAGWQQVSYEFTLTAETTICVVVMNPKKSNYSSGKDVLIDDATLTKK